MKLNTKMPVKLKPYFQRELNEYLLAFEKNKMEVSWKHLERAHILGQPYPIEHTYVHWKMLLFGIKTKNTKEVIGQIPRLLVGGVKSFVGKKGYSGDEAKQNIWKSDWFEMRSDKEKNTRFYENCLFAKSFNYTLSVIWEK